MSLIPLSYWKSKAGIVTDGLILHLDAKNYTSGSSIWNDLSPSADNMTMFHNGSGLPTYSTSYGGSVYFSKTNGNWGRSYINVNSTTPTVVTVEFWGKLSSSTPGAYMPFAFNTYNFYYLNAGIGFNTFNGDLYGVDSGRKSNFGTELRSNHYVLVMYQNQSYTNNEIWINGVKSYGNGQQLGSENASNRVFSSDGLFTLNGFGTYMGDIYIGECRVYDRALSQSEIIQNYNFTCARYSKPKYKPRVSPANLMFYFDFDSENNWYGESGSYVTDYSGIMYFGILSGGVGWNSDGGGNMEFRAASSRFINTIRSSSQFGLFYGSASFVTVIRSINQSNQEWFFGPEEPLSSQGDVRLGIGNNRVTYTHEVNFVDSFATYGSMSANTWYHVVFTYDYATYTVKIYINGTAYVTNGFEERMVANSTYFLGRAVNNYYSFDLGLFMVYNKVLSASEVTELYSTQKIRFGLP